MAAVALRRRLATAGCLAALAIAVSLSTHILVQNSVGYWNYAHFTAESLGAVCGVAYVLYARSKSRRGEPTRAGDDQAADHTRAGD